MPENQGKEVRSVSMSQSAHDSQAAATFSRLSSDRSEIAGYRVRLDEGRSPQNLLRIGRKRQSAPQDAEDEAGWTDGSKGLSRISRDPNTAETALSSKNLAGQAHYLLQKIIKGPTPSCCVPKTQAELLKLFRAVTDAISDQKRRCREQAEYL